jgi:protein-tyrosine phosphatase
MGNICRSPTAEGVFRKLLADRAPHLDVEVASAGTHAYHVGEPPDQRAMQAAAERGFDLSSIRARRVEASDFEKFNFVLAMDEDNFQLLIEACPEALRPRVGMFLDFHANPPGRNVPDPYYGSTHGFEHVLDLVEGASLGLIDELEKRGR